MQIRRRSAWPFLRNCSGQTLVEYALVLMLMALVMIILLRGIGTTTSHSYSRVNSALNP